jgi:hypothetical protein
MKGVAFHSLLAAVRELHGEATRTRVVAALPTERRELIERGGVSRLGWYPLPHYSELHDAVQTTLGGGEATARALGRAATELDMRGVLRFVLGLASPDLLMRHSERVFGAYVRGGTVSATLRSKDLYEISLVGLYGANRYVLAELEAGVALVLERTGARGVSVRRRSLADDCSSATLVATWT